VAVAQHSGLAGIAHWINSYFGLQGENAIDKKDPMVVKLKELVDDEYAKGRTTVMSDEELESMLRQIAPEFVEKFKKE